MSEAEKQLRQAKPAGGKPHAKAKSAAKGKTQKGKGKGKTKVE